MQLQLKTASSMYIMFELGHYLFHNMTFIIPFFKKFLCKNLINHYRSLLPKESCAVLISAWAGLSNSLHASGSLLPEDSLHLASQGILALKIPLLNLQLKCIDLKSDWITLHEMTFRQIVRLIGLWLALASQQQIYRLKLVWSLNLLRICIFCSMSTLRWARQP